MRFIFISACLLIVGCGEEDSRTSSKGKGVFLKASDFEGIATKIDKTFLEVHLSGLSEIYANKPKLADSEDPFSNSSCNDLKNLKIKATSTSIKLDSSGNCVSEEPKASMNYRMYIATTCEGGEDVSQYDGKNVSEFKSDDFCNSGTSSTQIANNEMTFDGKILELSFKTKIKTAMMKADGTPCKYSVSATEKKMENGCMDYSRTIATIGDEKSDRITIIKYVDVIQNNDLTSVWHKSGSMEISIGGWTGTVTFTGADTEPTYSFTAGTETATGTITAEAAE